MRTLALFGIDGSGKSALAKHLVARLPADGRTGVLTCPRYHHAPSTPHRALSETLDRMNGTGDALRSLEWKAIAVYLQLVLYGPARNALLDSGVETIISERHPLVDALVYGPYFSERLARTLSEAELGATYFPALEKIEPGAERRVREWFAAENRRMKRQLAFGDLPLYLKPLFGTAPEAMLAELTHHFGAPLPETAVFLDVAIPTALARIAGRGNPAELHEHEAGLTKLRAGYLAAFAWLGKKHPEIRIARIEVERGGRPRSLDELSAEVLSLMESR